ncbi:MAG: CDP-diacylglycerol--glycerol-3-phosphate 3-phosphatidyltransferase [Clostridiales Family XIII bacterium]|jgi:CDP-diacylglycerol--glycerol-3-phosphate 3-phosphatidyltransferase/cardiolipin synthase|nr:CDP-diacylglycerol--glycerol-3-phosphate 3-phosphatidyltransferase [Clostridiales Family XIII bacterium]
MNLPNRLTVLRMALVPVFLVLFYLGRQEEAVAGLPQAAYAAGALLVFGAASLTDMLDGKIARARGLITNFGKLMDPLADKVLTTAAFVCFVDVGYMPAWMLIVVLAREFAITGLRGVAASEGVVIAAGFTGKLKTVLQMAAILLILLENALMAIPGMPVALLYFLSMMSLLLLWAAIVMTVWSGIEYLWAGRHLLNAK